MAHAAAIDHATEQLVSTLSGLPRNTRGYARIKDNALKKLRAHNAARVSQFETAAKYEGLVEKFEVLNREDLASELSLRLKELPDKPSWFTEVLSFFLLLSDRPAQNTRLEDIRSLAPPETPSPNLTWDDILAEEPFSDEDIWENVERGYHSSGDESPDEAAEADLTISTQATSVHDDTLESLARQLLVRPATAEYETLKESHSRLESDGSPNLTSEWLLVRDTLSMLQGLPTRTYVPDRRRPEVTVRRRWEIGMSTPVVLSNLLRDFAQLGTTIESIRQWTRTDLHPAYVQSCQTAVQRHLKDTMAELGKMELRYCQSRGTRTIVSLLDLQVQSETIVAPLLRFAAILQIHPGREDSTPFDLLDRLYSSTCVAQATGYTASYTFHAEVFLAGLSTYLRSAGAWMSEGELDSQDDTFFVQENDSECPLGRFWNARYSLRTQKNKEILVANPIRRFARRIFAMGKERAFLLALDNTPQNSTTSKHATKLVFLDDLRRTLDRPTLISFSQALESAIDQWITASSQDCAAILRKRLLEDCKILSTQRAIEQVFCSSNGMLFQAFADSLFPRLQSTSNKTIDPFILIELVQETLGSSNEVETSNLSCSLPHPTTPQPFPNATNQPTTIHHLTSLNLTYLLPWQLQNITLSPTPKVHAQIFTFLLQTHYATSLLRSTFLSTRHLPTTPITSSNLPEDLINPLSTALRLRHRLLWFTDVLFHHLAQSSGSLGNKVRSALQEAEDIDSMVSAWRGYEISLQRTLLLAENLRPIKEAVGSILGLCEELVEVWSSLVEMVREDERDGYGDGGGGLKGRRLSRWIARMERGFEESLSFVVAGLAGFSRAGGNVELEAFVQRLDWQREN